MDLSVNGKMYQVDETPDRLLLWVLRDELGLTGTKFGCGVGICGSCTVHVDGEAIRSCLTTLSSVAGKEIRTLEGLAIEAILIKIAIACWIFSFRDPFRFKIFITQIIFYKF